MVQLRRKKKTPTKHAKLTKALIIRYLRMLKGKEGCNFHKGYKGQLIWKCAGGRSKVLSRKILKKLNLSPADISRVLSLAEKHGGYCDCEILFNATKALRAKSW